MKKEAVIRPTSDIVFKYLFGHTASTEILRAFINAVQRHAGQPEFAKITIVNPANDKDYFDAKMSVVDVRAETSTGALVNVEVQVRSQAEYGERSLYYWAKTYAGQLKENEEYKTLSPVISIAILDFCLSPPEVPWHSTYRLIEEHTRDHLLTKHLALHFLELPKVPEGEHGDLADWLFVLKHIEDREAEVKLILEDNVPLAELAKRYTDFSADKAARAAALSREMFLHDQASMMGNARREGLAEGLAEGEARGRAEGEARGRREAMLSLAKSLASRGMPEAEIQELTGLVPEEWR